MKKILLASLLLTGCLLSPDKPQGHNTVMSVECSEVPESVDTLGIAKFPCISYPKTPPEPQ